MAHTYIKFEFGTDEEKAQHARHKLDGWRQAFRLDKRVQYKLERPESTATETAAEPEGVEKPVAAARTKSKSAVKPSGKQTRQPAEAATAKSAPAAKGKVGLLVRLYFSSHEKLSEQRWLERIPSEEPFKSAAPKVIHQHDSDFAATDQQFESLS
jgi:hypothetical protein